jgi:cell division protein FtsB
MSALSQPSRPVRTTPDRGPAAQPRQSRPFLSLVPRRAHRAARTPFAVLVLVIAVLGLVGLLAINTHLQQGALQQVRLERDNQQLRERQAALVQVIDELEAPGSLAERASAYGMVPNPTPLFLRLSDGAVLGVLPQGEQQ